MPISKKLEKFLRENKVKYEPIEHRIVYTAFDKAQTLRVPQKIIGKTLVLKIDPVGKPSASNGASRGYALALIPANKNLDKGKFKKVTKVKNINFVKEAWIKKNIKGVKIGAIPPFGNLWKLPTFVDRSLINQSLAPKAPPRGVAIIVNGGDWKWSLKINPSVFKKLIPDLIIGNFSKAR